MDGAPANPGSSRIRPLLAGLLGLIPVVPIVAAIVISSGGVAAKASDTAAYIPATLPASPQSPASAAALPSGRGSLIAVVRQRTELRSSPGGHTFAKLPTKTEFGSPQVVWVAQHTGRWLGVVSPLAGNGRIGWIARSAGSLSRVAWELKVSLSARHLTVLKNGKTVKSYTVAVGRPTAPTPTGRFAVTDRLNTNDPSGPYGCCVLPLSAKSPHAIQGWNGGNRIAIHSTPETSSIGQPVSHGCLRLTLDEGRWLLAHIPLGTPTLISS